jgi:UDP-glucose 4-epimerase
VNPIALVTGGAGFIGGHLVSTLVRDGVRVRVLDDLSSGSPENLAGLESEVEFVRGDIRDAETLRDLTDGAGLVFHLAAVASVERCLNEPVETHDINATGTLQVLEASRMAGVSRVVFASSCAVYGDMGDDEAIETHPPSPISPYALHKYAGEIYCRQYTELRGLDTAALRFFNVYGPRQDPASVYAAVVPRFAAACLAGEAPTVHGDGEQTRDLVMVADVVRALRFAAEVPGAVGRVCNVGTGRRTSVNQLLAKLLEITEADVTPIHTPPRDGDLRDSVASLLAAREHLGFEASVDLSEGLQKTVAAMTEKSDRAGTTKEEA